MLKRENEKICLTKAEMELLGHILSEHLFGIEEEVKSPLISNKDKASLRREAKQVAKMQEKLGL